jgi:hypothetical protein
MITNLICISKYKENELMYSFYSGKRLVARVSSPDMTKEMLEVYRKYPVELIKDLGEEPKDYA